MIIGEPHGGAVYGASTRLDRLQGDVVLHRRRGEHDTRARRREPEPT